MGGNGRADCYFTDAGVLAQLLGRAPPLPANSSFLDFTAWGETYWLVHGRSLFLSSGARVLRDVKEELNVGGDFAWTPRVDVAVNDLGDVEPALAAVRAHCWDVFKRFDRARERGDGRSWEGELARERAGAARASAWAGMTGDTRDDYRAMEDFNDLVRGGAFRRVSKGRGGKGVPGFRAG